MYAKYLYRRILVAVLAAAAAHGASAATDGELRLEVVDSQTKQAIPVRVELTSARGRPVKLKNVGTGSLGGHFYLSGNTTLELRRGDYLFLLDAGPEYRTQRGDFTINRYADDGKTVDMRRFANLVEEGWYAGDMQSQRAARHLPIVAATENVYYVPSIAWHYDGKQWKATHSTVNREVDSEDAHAAGRSLSPTAARVQLAGGSLLLIGDEPWLRSPPLELPANATSLQVIDLADKAGLRIVAATPTAWELPLWIASGKLDAVCLLTHQTEWKKAISADPGGRPRDTGRYPGKQGLARWGMDVYFQLLNSGVRLTPVAGSGSGDNDSPLGTNRVYVQLSEQFSPAAWWQGVERGATVVTNGPLLRPNVHGESPGATFYLEQGETDTMEIALNLATRTTVEYLEIIKNGEVYDEVRLSDWAGKGGRLPPVAFDDSGWFAVRAATVDRDKYQFALTAPYYVKSSAGPRIGKRSTEFFLAWLDELQPVAGKSVNCTPEEIDTARNYWQSLHDKANAP